MATQRATRRLLPQLGAVLGSLDISLDAELTRYRRNRRLNGLGQENGYSNIESNNIESDLAFDVDPIKVASVSTPPPVPLNRKLMAAGYYNRDSPSSHLTTLRFSTQQESDNPADERTSSPADISASTWISLLTEADETKAVGSGIVPTIFPQTHSPLGQFTQARHLRKLAQTLSRMRALSSYLASPKKLIESLEDKPAQSNPAEPAINRSRYKTVSLLAGAVLGYLGFVAGLGASYVMSNPLVSQQLANGLTSPGIENTDAAAFDPPGPDLSSAEFIKLKIDTLSSLQMPKSDPITPSTISLGQLPATPSTSGLSSASAPAETSVIPSMASPSSASLASVATETQAAVLPIGQTYYVTVPFTSEQALWQIRQTIGEAFVRRFADGNRIQVAAFGNAQSAEQFLEKLKENNIEAEVYGPTTE